MCKRLSLEARKKICGKSTELLSPKTQLTVPISPTDLPEEFSWVPGVTHTHLHRGRAQRNLDHCSRSLCLHPVLYRVMKRLPGLEEIGMISASCNRQLSLWPGNDHRLSQWPSCPHRAHGSFCSIHSLRHLLHHLPVELLKAKLQGTLLAVLILLIDAFCRIESSHSQSIEPTHGSFCSSMSGWALRPSNDRDSPQNCRALFTSCNGHHGHCFLVLGLPLVVRSLLCLEDMHFIISFVPGLSHLGRVRS